MTDLEPMTRNEARDYIPQWGSFMRAGDPGAIAYGSIPPATKEQRDALVSYLRNDCLPIAQSDGQESDEFEYGDVDMLQRAITYLESIPYGSSNLEIEICPHEPRASAYYLRAPRNGVSIRQDSTLGRDLSDCVASGDVQPACEYVRDVHKPRFVIIALNAAGKYENREATDSEICATARAIYFDSESDLDNDADLARTYLIWEAASQLDADWQESEQRA